MPKTILVVEDEADILKIIIFRLKKAGYQIMTAINGREALDLLKKKDSKPDLIILDLVMPVIDGYEVCKHLKADAALETIPVLLLTASATTNLIEKVKITKANDYLLKPFEPAVLLSKTKALLGEK